MNGFLKHIGVYETYSELIGTKYDKEKLTKIISQLPLGGVLVILSQFNSLPTDDPKIKLDFLKFLNENYSGIKPLKKNRILYSKQGLLGAWKWLLAYGDNGKIDQNILIESGINLILYINLIVSDYFYNETITYDAIEYDIFTNSLFNTNNDLISSLARASVMYDEIAKNKKNFEEKEYININELFVKKYGYSIKEYLAVIFTLSVAYIKRKSIITPEWNRTYEFFSEAKHPEIAKNIIDELSISFLEAREWALSTLDQPWNFTKFRQKPILKFDDGKFIPISLSFLYEQMFSELYFKIRHLFPRNNTQIISFFGRIFEKYIEIIANDAISLSNIPYEFFPEFQYGAKRSKKSPDVLIKLGNKLLAIEAKVYRVKMDTFIGNSQDAIDSDIYRMAVSPLIQLHARLKELKELNHPVMDGIEEIYIMSVTLGDLPSIPPFEKKIESKLSPIFDLPIRGHYHLDVEEFEMMFELVSRRNSSPIFKYLNNKLKMNTSFRNYMFQSHLHPRMFLLIKNDRMLTLLPVQNLPSIMTT